MRKLSGSAASRERMISEIGRPATATPPNLKLIVGGKRR